MDMYDCMYVCMNICIYVCSEVGPMSEYHVKYIVAQLVEVASLCQALGEQKHFYLLHRILSIHLTIHSFIHS